MAIISAIMVPHPPLIIPEVGRGQEKAIQKTIDCYGKAAKFIADSSPDVIVITSPHSVMYSDYFHISPGNGAHGDFGQFGARETSFKVSYDTEFVDELAKAAEISGLSAGTMGERDSRLDHATMVPLYFIQKAYGGNIPVPIVRIGLSGLSLSKHYKLGILIKSTAEKLNRKTAVVASGDLSHVLKADGPYGFHSEGPVYDRRIMDVMSRAAFGELFDFDSVFCEKAAECGHRSFVIMAGCFDGVNVQAEELSYEGPFGVGYGICSFTPGGGNAERLFLEQHNKKIAAEAKNRKTSEDDFVNLARRSLESYIKRHEVISIPADLPEELTKKRSGVFVSLHEDGQLRGCIGTIGPVTSCVAEEIIRNAISASTQDPRFDPVKPDELDKLVYSVDVLGEKENIDSPSELDVKKYGVIVTNGGRRGLLLPNLDGVDTVDDQISIAKRKAGIGDKEPVKLQRFEVVRHF